MARGTIKTTTEIIIGKGTKYQVTLVVVATGGKGFNAFIYGGENSHVGGVAMMSRKFEETHDFPKHDDSKVANEVAKIIYDAFSEPVIVTAGVEIQDATDKDLAQLKTNYIAAARYFCATYDR